MWYAVDNPQRRTFAEGLRKSPAAVSDVISLKPSFEPSKENLDKRNFSFVSIYLKKPDTESRLNILEYIVFEPSKPSAEGIAELFGKSRFGENFDKVIVYPRNYLREARVLLEAGKIIKEEDLISADNAKPQIRKTKESADLPKIYPYSTIYEKLLKLIPNLIEHLEAGVESGKSKSEPYMDLNFDFLHKDSEGRYRIALSHYYEQNGDLIADPDMEIRIDPSMQMAEGLTYQDTYGYKEVYEERDGKEYVNTALKRELNRFLNQWLNNLINQGHKIDLTRKEEEETEGLEIEKGESIAETEETSSGFIYSAQEAKDIRNAFQELKLKVAFTGKEAFEKDLPVIDLVHRYEEVLEEYQQKIEKPAIEKTRIYNTELNFIKGDKALASRKKELKGKIQEIENQLKVAQRIIEDEYMVFQDEVFREVRARVAKAGYYLVVPDDIIAFRDDVMSGLFDNRQMESYFKEPVSKIADRSIAEFFEEFQDHDDEPNTLFKSEIDPLANEHGIYTPQTAGANFETINIPIPKTAKYEAEIELVKTSAGDYKYGISASKKFGDFSGTGYAPYIEDTSYASRQEALGAALKKHHDRVKQLLEAPDSILDNEAVKNKQLSAALKAVEDFAKENNLINLFPAESETKKLKEPKNQHELNKAIEQFIDEKDQKGGTYTAEDKNYISQYTGSGGLYKQGAKGTGILFEYYTPDEVVKRMWGLAMKYGFTGGYILEPSVGTGNFLKYVPKGSSVQGYEVNHYSKRIAEILYPKAAISETSFESLFFAGNVHLKDDHNLKEAFDLAIGNPPYGEFSGRYAGMGEKKWTGALEYEHYFMLRSLDLLKSKGLLVFLIPSHFLSNEAKYTPVKEKIAAKADLIDAYRLPTKLFKTTDIGTDIIVLRKK